MGITKKIVTVVTVFGMAMGLSIATASPASADPWIEQPQILEISNRKTAYSVKTPIGTVQVRYGTHQGRQYGWGRTLNVSPPTGGRHLLFEVDTNGDRIPDDQVLVLAGKNGSNWTKGYRTSASSARAFRACILDFLESACADTSNRTPWW
ncbi:hypothetical protein [Nocardiopsis sp. ATB16-24]|uniref:hypothetical protein n=1 Tax=Nocardiopsis sp. ATB16-24 TaxID=3019555 RepID=UPI002552D670|nr:hypothetical protein [Nocardiopsis sp. ATB16-24]